MSAGQDVDDSPPLAFAPNSKALFQISGELTGDDAEFQRIREWCIDGRYVCAAENCEDRALTVVPLSFHRKRSNHNELTPHRAHFKHRAPKRHGAPTGGRASAAESSHHLAAKHYLQTVGEALGLQIEVEVFASDGEGVARRPDVVWYPPDGGKPWAFEVQFSPIQTWEWRDRNKDLLALGFRPFWLWGYSSDSEMRILSMPDEKAWREKYTIPSDVWMVQVGSDATGIADLDRVNIAECFSDESFRWEKRRVLGVKQPFPTMLWADRSLQVLFHGRRGLICPELEGRLASAAESANDDDLPDRSAKNGGIKMGRLGGDSDAAIVAAVQPGPNGVYRQSVMCRCGFPNYLPAIKRSRLYDPEQGGWTIVEQAQEGWPDHPCCHYWMTEKGKSSCVACEGSRAAERNRKARL